MVLSGVTSTSMSWEMGLPEDKKETMLEVQLLLLGAEGTYLVSPGGTWRYDELGGKRYL